jgi:hypothetical protein
VARPVSPALRALCRNLIDYAGVFPPASLTIDEARRKYAKYIEGEHAWMLNRFVIDSGRIGDLPATWNLAVLSDCDHPRAAAIETRSVLTSTAKPVYCELPLESLPDIKRAGSFAKFRCQGAATPEIAIFLRKCQALGLPFKLTAGLHGPMRSSAAHGFINVFAAAAFAHTEFERIEAILDETDAGSFHFGSVLEWRGHSLTPSQITAARQHFAHSLGSCSFEEPVAGLQALGWL